MLDANFKLKQKARNHILDPDLAEGMAYFVEDGRYKKHLKNKADEKEASNCYE